LPKNKTEQKNLLNIGCVSDKVPDSGDSMGEKNKQNSYTSDIKK
jgi:hypothetical protein